MKKERETTSSSWILPNNQLLEYFFALGSDEEDILNSDEHGSDSDEKDEEKNLENEKLRITLKKKLRPLNWSVKQRSIRQEDAKYAVNVLKTVEKQNSEKKLFTYVSNVTFYCIYPTVLSYFIPSPSIMNKKLTFCDENITRYSFTS